MPNVFQISSFWDWNKIFIHPIIDWRMLQHSNSSLSTISIFSIFFPMSCSYSFPCSQIFKYIFDKIMFCHLFFNLTDQIQNRSRTNLTKRNEIKNIIMDFFVFSLSTRWTLTRNRINWRKFPFSFLFVFLIISCSVGLLN